MPMTDQDIIEAQSAVLKAVTENVEAIVREHRQLRETLRAAFPHFQDDAPITAEKILEIGRDYQNMVVNWSQTPRTFTFQDQEGHNRTIEYCEGDTSAGVRPGWKIPEDADWRVEVDPDDDGRNRDA
jgi:hypothetical protein